MLPMGEGWIHLFVDADEEVRVARATTRDGDEADVRRRVAAQADREEWLAWADEVIDNSGSVEELYFQVDAWWAQLLSP
jgi:dephospho-CoA kinase